MRSRACCGPGDYGKIHEIHHVGKRYRVEGPHLVAPSPQRTPVLFQAGSSTAGGDFAARNAEAQFIITPGGHVTRLAVKSRTSQGFRSRCTPFADGRIETISPARPTQRPVVSNRLAHNEFSAFGRRPPLAAVLGCFVTQPILMELSINTSKKVRKLARATYGQPSTSIEKRRGH
jgi:hypothetical protein